MSQLTPETPSTIPPLPQHRAAWPTVIGIITIVWAGLGLLSTTCLLIMTSGGAATFIPEPERDQFMQEMFSSPSAQLPLVLFALLLNVFLLWGGIALLRRRPSSRGILNCVAVLDIIYVLISTSLETMHHVSNLADPDRTSAIANSIAGFIGIVMGLVFGLALPIILLYFMNARSRRATIDSWSA